ncbi:MAG: alpha/beta hydrolase [Chloroflexota bacterium]
MIYFQTIKTDDVNLSVAIEGDGPLCVLVHGWPEIWLSWRNQIEPLVNAGYKVAVPDVRGYGGSDAPREVEAYSMRVLANDVVHIIESLGYDEAILIGHDWGAPIVWHTALLHPNRVRAVIGMSMPYTGLGGAPPTQLFQAAYPNRFFYILYFQKLNLPEAEFEKDVRDALVKIYFSNCGETTKEARQAMRARTPESGYLDGLIAPDPFPEWLSPEDLEQYVLAYEKSGFHGGMNRYRNMDSDWYELQHLAGKKIEQPALFLAGEYDSVLRFTPGLNLMDFIDQFYADLRGKIVIPGAGHWVQQEKPNEVNENLLAFLRDV